MKTKLFSLLILAGVLLMPLSSFAQKKRYLRKRNVTDLSLMMDQSNAILPGQHIPIGFQVVMSTGEAQNTKGYGDGKIKWDNFDIQVKGGQFVDGNLIVSTIPEEIADHKIYLNVTAYSSNGYSERFEIDINYVKTIELTYNASKGISPGISVPFMVNATLDNGMTYSGGQLDWRTLVLQVNGERISGASYLLPSDPRMYQNNRTYRVTAMHVSNTQVTDEVILQMDFKTAYECVVSGKSGRNGQAGARGNTGSAGRSGSYSSSGYRGDGGPGQNGTNGQSGWDGERGQDGHSLDVYIKADYDAELGTLLKVQVLNKNTGEVKYYLINPAGGSLVVNARGGAGGTGGEGGYGGDGGRGGNSSSTTTVNGVTTGGGNGGNGGNGGSGGNGGDGGDGGDGGSITVYVDPTAQNYMHLFTFLTEGGNGGKGGNLGRGGSGGTGGDSRGRGFYDERRGQYGQDGRPGTNGNQGRSGPAPQLNYQYVGLDW